MMEEILSSVLDRSRNTVFNIGDRVHWFRYSSDMIIVGGGYGIIIEIEKRVWSSGEAPFLKVLKDGGSIIESFPIQDCDLEEQWED